MKSSISNDADITRGLYQCIKYRAVMEAMARAQQVAPIIHVILVLEARLPQALRRLKNLLGIEVIDELLPL